MPVSMAVSVTLAPGITESDASRTVPTTVAVSNCAAALAQVRSSTPIDTTKARIVGDLTAQRLLSSSPRYRYGAILLHSGRKFPATPVPQAAYDGRLDSNDQA